MWIDSHCHLDAAEFHDDLEAVLLRAAAAGVDAILAMGGGAAPGTLDGSCRLARRQPAGSLPRLCAAVGIHPHEAARAEAASLTELRQLARADEVVAIGEIGLDFHYDLSPRDCQREIFEQQLDLAGELGLPVSIHCRAAWQEVRQVLEPRARAGRPAAGVMHCFAGSETEAREALDLGLYLSFSGMLTFAKAENIRAAARLAPAERILIETDAPFLAPVPHRGKRNEPAWVALTGAKLAELRGAALPALGDQLAENFNALFAPRHP